MLSLTVQMMCASVCVGGLVYETNACGLELLQKRDHSSTALKPKLGSTLLHGCLLGFCLTSFLSGSLDWTRAPRSSLPFLSPLHMMMNDYHLFLTTLSHTLTSPSFCSCLHCTAKRNALRWEYSGMAVSHVKMHKKFQCFYVGALF
ncbi:hypothetical protein BT93_H2994 [Corymbia citriodora subsp. variegata]|nr:hypothetical protein BT93_H2994 [Corymbia citriodora subsp. variegata]KAF8017960.1 hypothetical protein BT93_H2994 [Corymbia citriodora subsp. variegata]